MTTNPTRNVTLGKKVITLTQWGPHGMWGVPNDAAFGQAFYGRTQAYKHRKTPVYVYICEGKYDRACFYGRYEYFATVREMRASYPDALEFDGSGEIWTIAIALRKLLPGESIIAGIPQQEEATNVS